MPFLYRLYSDETLSTTRFRLALQQVLMKHQSLRTSLIFDTDKNQLMQQIIELSHSSNKSFAFIESTFETDEELNKILHEEKRNPQLFDPAHGRVFRCHLVYYKQILSNDLLCDKDALIFNFHHALFDFPSMDVFLDDLNQAYKTGLLSNDDNNTLRYLDCKYKYFLYFSFRTHSSSFI